MRLRKAFEDRMGVQAGEVKLTPELQRSIFNRRYTLGQSIYDVRFMPNHPTDFPEGYTPPQQLVVRRFGRGIMGVLRDGMFPAPIYAESDITTPDSVSLLEDNERGVYLRAERIERAAGRVKRVLNLAAAVGIGVASAAIIDKIQEEDSFQPVPAVTAEHVVTLPE